MRQRWTSAHPARLGAGVPRRLVASAVRACAVAFGGALALAGCASVPQPLEIGGTSMGTTWSVKAGAPEAQRDALLAAITARLDALVDEMSAWEPESALSRFNRAAPGSNHRLPPDLCAVLAHALALASETDGAYDPTIGALAALWGFGPDAAPRAAPPARTEIDAARARVGWRNVAFDPSTCRAQQPGGVLVDVSSLGPGYAVDQIAALLDAAGVVRYLVELGGEMRARGARPDGRPWRVAVERPGDPAAQDVILALRDGALGTSGDYRSGFTHEGRRYSHTLDPRTGEPVQHALAAVTVVAETALAADALAAALLVQGPEAGFDFAQARGVAAVFTLRNGADTTRRTTPALARYRSP